ncbi:hypothetical protein BVI2075_550003 [Burkholderia vietnamiensis]|nr:hypothetical protein BVI1335_1020003 [Burkholderia vietnamiensis]CAG9212453.1 hypothetical protein BVI2075_550003 [Burkholderia vietnamiensis]
MRALNARYPEAKADLRLGRQVVRPSEPRFAVKMG